MIQSTLEPTLQLSAQIADVQAFFGHFRLAIDVTVRNIGDSPYLFWVQVDIAKNQGQTFPETNQGYRNWVNGASWIKTLDPWPGTGRYSGHWRQPVASVEIGAREETTIRFDTGRIRHQDVRSSSNEVVNFDIGVWSGPADSSGQIVQDVALAFNAFTLGPYNVVVGNNNRGYFRLHPDGTQWCWFGISARRLNNSTLQVVWEFPRAFITEPEVFVSRGSYKVMAHTGFQVLDPMVTEITPTQCTIQVLRDPNSSSWTLSSNQWALMVFAFGRAAT